MPIRALSVLRPTGEPRRPFAFAPKTGESWDIGAGNSGTLVWPPARENRRWAVALGSGALAMTRPDDVPTRFRWAHRLGWAAACAVTLYAQGHRSTTGRSYSLSTRAELGLAATAGLLSYLAYEPNNRLTVATDAWLNRRGIDHPRVVAAAAAAASVGLGYLAGDQFPGELQPAETVDVPLPKRIRDAVMAVLDGLEEREPATARAIRAQLPSATMAILDYEIVDEMNIPHVYIGVGDVSAPLAVPHAQTLLAGGEFVHRDRPHEIRLEVTEGRLWSVSVDDLGDDDAPDGEWEDFRLADWPAPERITVFHRDSSPRSDD